jgi:Transposase, Mutator family
MPPCELWLNSEPPADGRSVQSILISLLEAIYPLIFFGASRVKVRDKGPVRNKAVYLAMGRLGTATHDYKRHGTTTLFAALNVLDGTVIGRNMQRHRHQEFIRFLNAVEAKVAAGKVVHSILDNYAAHKHPKVRQWLATHPD